MSSHRLKSHQMSVLPHSCLQGRPWSGHTTSNRRCGKLMVTYTALPESPSHLSVLQGCLWPRASQLHLWATRFHHSCGDWPSHAPKNTLCLFKGACPRKKGLCLVPHTLPQQLCKRVCPMSFSVPKRPFQLKTSCFCSGVCPTKPPGARPWGLAFSLVGPVSRVDSKPQTPKRPCQDYPHLLVGLLPAEGFPSCCRARHHPRQPTECTHSMNLLSMSPQKSWPTTFSNMTILARLTLAKHLGLQ